MIRRITKKAFHVARNKIRKPPTNKTIFKKNLKMIEIETFSYCNRKCWFCPNSFIDRISDNKIMPEDVYLDLIDQLAEVDYSGEITYSRYN